jgi:nitrogen fixation NifU-like protein
MKIMIKVSPELDSQGHQTGQSVISDIKFLTMGCAAAIATSSMTTELAKGKRLDEAEKITSRDVSLALGELPPIKEHCSNLAADALKLAIANFRGNRK